MQCDDAADYDRRCDERANVPRSRECGGQLQHGLGVLGDDNGMTVNEAVKRWFEREGNV